MKRTVSLILAIVISAGCLLGMTACQNNGNVVETDLPETEAPETDAPETDAPDDDEELTFANSIVAETKDLKLNAAMMAYMLIGNLQNYSTYLSLLGVDTSVSLKEQSCVLLESGTWFDYFVITTQNQAAEILVFAQGARDAGIELTDEEKEVVKSSADDIGIAAAKYGYPDVDTYLYEMTGNEMSLTDIRECLTLNALANKYYTYFIDSVDPTYEEREAYYAENADSFNYIDVYKYNVLASDFEAETEAQQRSLALAHAEELAATEGIDGFTAAIRAEIDKVTVQRDTETEAQLAEKKEALFMSTYNELVPVTELSAEVLEWTRDAGAGDTYVENVDGTTFTVYMLVKTPYRSEKMARNIRHILFSYDSYTDSAEAERVLDEFIAAGATEEEFIRLAKEYSEDGSAENGGLYENVVEGQMVKEFEGWMFDSSRQVGDYGIVETDYGWHLMFYPGEGEYAYWEVTANTAIAYDRVEEYFEEKSADIEFDRSAIDKIRA